MVCNKTFFLYIQFLYSLAGRWISYSATWKVENMRTTTTIILNSLNSVFLSIPTWQHCGYAATVIAYLKFFPKSLFGFLRIVGHFIKFSYPILNVGCIYPRCIKWLSWTQKNESTFKIRKIQRNQCFHVKTSNINGFTCFYTCFRCTTMPLFSTMGFFL